MNWNDIPADTMERLSRMYERREPLDAAAEALGVKPKSLIRRIQEHRTYKKRLEFARTFTIPISPTPSYTGYEVLKGDDWLIISDLEIPDHDESMIEAVIRTGIGLGINRLIIAGDLLANDQFSAYPVTWADGSEMTFEVVRKMGRDLLDTLHQQFSDIVFITGNHDRRVGKATKGHIHLNMLFEGTNATFSHYPYLFIETRNGPVYVCHPAESKSQNPYTLGLKLYANTATPNKEKCHIVFGHTHLVSWGFSPDGLRREIHSIGCIRNPEKTQYKKMSTNVYAQWVSSFMVIQGGHFRPLTKYGTDWKALLGDLAPIF